MFETLGLFAPATTGMILFTCLFTTRLQPLGQTPRGDPPNYNQFGTAMDLFIANISVLHIHTYTYVRVYI